MKQPSMRVYPCSMRVSYRTPLVFFLFFSCSTPPGALYTVKITLHWCLVHNKKKYTPVVRSIIRRNSYVQAACDTPMARFTGCVFSLD